MAGTRLGFIVNRVPRLLRPQPRGSLRAALPRRSAMSTASRRPAPFCAGRRFYAVKNLIRSIFYGSQFWRYPRTSMMPCRISARLILWEPSSPLGLQTKKIRTSTARVRKNPIFAQCRRQGAASITIFLANVTKIPMICHILQRDGINCCSWREKREKHLMTRVFGVSNIHPGHIPGLHIANPRPTLLRQLLMPDLHAHSGFIPEK